MIAPAGLAFNNFIAIVISVATLYFAREVLVPIALAALLSFALSPVVKVLQHWRLPRSLAAIAAIIAALAVTISLSAMIIGQVNQLSGDLPRYQSTLSQKVHKVRDFLGPAELFKNASSLLTQLGQELEGVDPQGAPRPLVGANSSKPIPVEIQQPTPGQSDKLVALLRPLVTPLATGGIVLLFVTFFLFQREDLRDRFILLAGSGDIERTTTAMDDAGRRLGKLFATQLILNAAFGVIIGAGLALIGVPSAPLWGLVAMILRFVPYVGAPLSAILPLTLAAAVSPDWSMTLWTLALFLIVEPLTGYFIEPYVCGRSAGLSPVSIIVAAAFWTWLWGPLGLLVSTPLTLCLVVLARHVDQFKFIDVMLGDRPALTPQQAAYHRMLTGDPIDAIEQARNFVKENTVIQYYEEILIRGLQLAQADAEMGRLDDARLDKIVKFVSELVEDLAEHHASDETIASDEHSPDIGKVVSLGGGEFKKTVFCIPGLGRLDQCAAMVVADALKREGINARVTEATTSTDEASWICLCYLQDVSKARLEYDIRKFSKTSAKHRILSCLLSVPDEATSTKGEEVRSLRATIAAVKDSKLGIKEATFESRKKLGAHRERATND